MNHGEDWNDGSNTGSRGRPPASGHRGYRQRNETPVTVVGRSDNTSRGSRGRGTRTTSSPRNSSNDEHFPVQAQVDRMSQEDGIGSTTKQPDASMISWNLLKSSAPILSGGLSVYKECEENSVKDGTRMPCDLANQMKDVSLSYKDSVSSTSHHKVEDHAATSHKSAVSSSESSAWPFDIVIKKTVIGLKPSLKEMNKAKRNAAKGYTGTVIRPGMVLLKNYLSINDQVMIVNKCRQLGLGEGGFYQPGYRDGALLHLKMMCLGKNWDPETSRYGETRPIDDSIPPKIPIEFLQFVDKAVKESQSLVAKFSKNMNMKGEDEIPSMSPDICIANFYTTTGRLGLHQDKDESKNSIRKGLPVVSFSIGDSAEFLYSDQWDDQKAEMVVLESGDVLIFGGKSRNVFHGVRSILKGTAPKVLVDETSLRPGRLNLTFRQY